MHLIYVAYLHTSHNYNFKKKNICILIIAFSINFERELSGLLKN